MGIEEVEVHRLVEVRRRLQRVHVLVGRFESELHVRHLTPPLTGRSRECFAPAMDLEITEIASGLRFPEGPVWMPDESLLCVELLGGTVLRVQPDGKKEVVSENGGSPNGLAIGPDGAVYVCNSGGHRAHDRGGALISRHHFAPGPPPGPNRDRAPPT